MQLPTVRKPIPFRTYPRKPLLALVVIGLGILTLQRIMVNAYWPPPPAPPPLANDLNDIDNNNNNNNEPYDEPNVATTLDVSTLENASHAKDAILIDESIPLSPPNNIDNNGNAGKPYVESPQDQAIRAHFENGAWFEKGRKYFAFQTSGGLSNQRIILETALIIAETLNRTVIVNQAAWHSSMWYNYNRIKPYEMLPADELFDGRLMNRMASTIFLRVLSLKRFVEKNENQHNQIWHRVERDDLDERRAEQWTVKDLQRKFGKDRADVLFFAKGTMWEGFDFEDSVVERARRSVRANGKYRSAARRAVLDLFPRGFNALHIRFMDPDGLHLREGFLSSNRDFIHRMRFFDKSLPLYIATVPKRRGTAYFNGFTSPGGFSVVYGDVLESREEIKALISPQAIPPAMVETVLGLIEQLVCARAVKFLGTGFSTFSEHIRRMRRWRELVVADDDNARNDPAEDQFVKTVTACTIPTRPC